MICKWGMSKTLGPQAFIVESGGFIEGAGGRLPMGHDTAKLIDQEINELLSSCYDEAARILKKEQCLLENLAEILLEVETLDGEEFDIIVKCSVKKEAAAMKDSEHDGSTCAIVKESCSVAQLQEEVVDAIAS
jgi:cell division protease FtsH